MLDALAGRDGVVRARPGEQPLEAVDAEHPPGDAGLDHAVGDEHELVARAQLDLAIGQPRGAGDPERRAGLADSGGRSVQTAE